MRNIGFFRNKEVLTFELQHCNAATSCSCDAGNQRAKRRENLRK